MASQVELFEDAFPLIVCVMPNAMNAGAVDEMATGFERLFQRGERYALISCNRRGTSSMLAKERRLVADWANQPRVREMAGKLCIGSATIVDGAMQRAALTAILWFWTPSFPHETVATAGAAVDHCIASLASAGMKSGMPRERLVRAIEERTR